MQLRPLILLSTPFLAAQALAQTGNPTVLFTEIPTSPTSIVPGARDAGGNPVVTNFLTLTDLAVRPNATEYILKGTSGLGSTLDQILVHVGPGGATALAQDGQAVQGGAAGELYDFFDTDRPVAWDSAGNMVFSARVKGGVASVFEKVIKVVGGVHTIVAQMGDAVIGISDLAPAVSGDELLGNSISGLYLLDGGDPAYYVTPLTNCSSTRYPAIIRGHTAFRYCAVSPVGAELWDNISLGDHGGTSDGLHWYALGDTLNANTAIDNILAVDDVIVLQEGSPAGAGGPTIVDFFEAGMAPNGSWWARGDDAASNDWAVMDGVLLAKSGDPISGTENWGAVFASIAGNSNGRWALVGDTDNVDPLANQVLVVDGTVLLREGQPLDVNGNSLFDDDAFLATFHAFDLRFTDTDEIFSLITLRNGAGTSLGDGMIRVAAGVQPEPFCFGDGLLVDHTTACPCANDGITGRGCAHSFDPSGASIGWTGQVSADTVVLETNFTPSTSFTLFMQHDAAGDTIFHDGVLCAGGTLTRLRGRNAVAGQAFFPNSNFANDSTLTLSQRGGVIVGSGATRYYAGFYRNASTTFCPPATANVTNGLRIVW